MDTPLLRQAGRDPLSLALIDARNCSLRRFEAFERAKALDVPCEAELDPPAWSLGQLGWFQEYWIARNVERYRGRRCDPSRPRLASVEPNADRWYHPAEATHEQRWELDLPDLGATREYLVETLEATLDLLIAAPEAEDGLYLFRLALFHEDLRAETFACMAQTLGIPMPDVIVAEPMVPREPLLVPHCRWQLGSPPDEGFVFDNEKWAHEVLVPEFEIDAQPVTWAQYLEFIEDHGYSDARWWSEAGWNWVQESARTAPRHVEQVRHGVLMRRFGTLMQVALHAPVVHVCAHEAEAWCRWAGRRLPLEVEWEAAATLARSRGFRWGEVWEWTASRFQPYQGFEADPWREYSEPAFGTHRVLRGASWATRGRLRHPRHRGFLQPERDDTFSGFRSCAL